MNWNDIAVGVGKVAPILGGLLGGKLGASVGGIISEALGVDNTPEAVEKELKENPEAFLKLRQLEIDKEVKLKELEAGIDKEWILGEKGVIQAVNNTMIAEGKSEHWMQYTWRPFIGYCVGISTLGGVVICIGAYIAMLLGKPEGMANLSAILTALAGLNATTLPILGIASYFRGKEKLKGVN